jgi:hypothetical protein
VCVTHVDEDHIVGVQSLLREMKHAKDDGDPEPFRIKRVWHNAVQEIVEVGEPGLAASVQQLVNKAAQDAAAGVSIKQGRDVRDTAANLGLGGNTPFGPAVMVGKHATIGELVVTVVAPDQNAIDELTEKWRAAKQQNSPAVIAQAFTDPSVTNLSSIAMYFQLGAKTALLTGDARGDHVLAGLEKVGLLKPDKPLEVDLLQLPHHGSQNNVAPTFFERIRARHYVASSDGIKHKHPSDETLRMLVKSRGINDVYTVHLNNDVTRAREVLEALKTTESRAFDVKIRPATERAVAIDIG